MNILSVYPAIVRFLEASTRAARLRVTRPLERRMARQVAQWFVDQGKAVVKALRPLAGRFDQNAALAESLAPSDWLALVGSALLVGSKELEGILERAYGAALVGGARVALNGFGKVRVSGDTLTSVGLGVAFRLRDPLAVAWAEGRAANQVTRINDTTRDRLNGLLVEAVEKNWAWNTTADRINEMFVDFAGPPLFPSKKFTSRAQAIAAYEIGDAYEAGGMIAMQTVAATGVAVEKKWLNAGDNRVRSAHRANAGEGWIGLEDAFAGDGAERPPTDPGCRCTLVYRKQ